MKKESYCINIGDFIDEFYSQYPRNDNEEWYDVLGIDPPEAPNPKTFGEDDLNNEVGQAYLDMVSVWEKALLQHLEDKKMWVRVYPRDVQRTRVIN